MASLPNLRLYDLRHSAATLLFAAGAPIKVVSEVLGHASVNLTQNTYIHVIPGMHQQAVRNMGAMLSAAAGNRRSHVGRRATFPPRHRHRGNG